MTEKYERRCWNCDSKDMEKKGSFIQCNQCGATWNYALRLGPDPLAPHGFYLEDAAGIKLGRMLRPSKSVLRAAEKARAQK